MRFGDGSSIRYEGKGEVHVDFSNGKCMIFNNVLYIPKLKPPILSFLKLEDRDCDIRLRNGFLTLNNSQERLLTKILKTKGNVYLMKLNITKQCL